MTSSSTSESAGITRCPVCRRRLDPATPIEVPCPRCDTDLTSVRLCHLHASRERERAARLLASGRSADALRAARRSIALVDCEAGRSLLTRIQAAAAPV